MPRFNETEVGKGRKDKRKEKKVSSFFILFLMLIKPNQPLLVISRESSV